MRSRTGIAGCGRMGAPMLAALRAAGVPARGYDVLPMDTSHITDAIAVFSEDLDTLITVVRDIDETEAVLFGDQNFAAIPSLIRIIICSTLSPRYVASLRARIPALIALIDARMSVVI